MVINHNVPALFTHLSMRRADRGLQQAMTRLSSGIRINSAREDAAGLAIANKLNYQVGGLGRASENATHGISLIQTAEGALNEIHNMLQRMRELSVQAAHGTLMPNQRAMIQQEIDQLTNEIHSISRNTEYNRMRILNGEADRITEMHMIDPVSGDASVSRNIVSTLFVNGSVPPGRLDYTIVAVGEPAVMEFNLAAPTTTPPPHGAVKINGVTFTFSEGDTWGDFMNGLNEKLLFADMHFVTGTDDISGDSRSFLVTNLAGRNQEITISGEGALITHLGLTPNATASGTDAEVIINGMVDVNGTPIPGSGALGVSASGNQLLIRGTFGEEIRMNIQVMLDPDPTNPIGTAPRFLFGNGDDVVNDLDMSMHVREYGPLMLQIGASHNQAMPVQIPRLNAETLGLVQYVGGQQRKIINVRPSKTDVSRGGIVQTGAEAAINILDSAISTVSNARARLGAYQNRLESTVRNLDVAAENTEVSRSRIQDTDMARETTRFAQYNVMFQAAMSVLAQANQRPQQIISLLQ